MCFNPTLDTTQLLSCKAVISFFGILTVSIPHWIRLSYSALRAKMSATIERAKFQSHIGYDSATQGVQKRLVERSSHGFNPTLDTTQLLSRCANDVCGRDHSFQSHIGYDSATQLTEASCTSTTCTFQSHIGYDSATQLRWLPRRSSGYAGFQSHIGYDSATQVL